MIRFVHTADIHFGIENYGRIDSKTGIHTRLSDFYNALSFCVDRAIAEDVDFFLFSGDAYKTAIPSPTQQRLLFDCFLRLFRAHIPLIILIGNHDNPLSFGKAHALELFNQLPVSGFHVISKPDSFVLETKSGPIQIIGIPWPSRINVALYGHNAHSTAQDVTQYISRGVSALIDDFVKKLDPTVPAVLAGHLTVSSGLFSGSEKRAVLGNDPVFMPSQLALKPLDYVALGHLHRYQNVSPDGSIPVVYAGSPERIDFGEQAEEKGFCLVTIHDKNKTTHEFIKTPTRPFILCETHLNEQESQTEQIIKDLKNYTLEGAVLKIVYHVPAGKKDRVDVVAVQQACIAAHYLVGIFPVRIPEPRERRINLKVTMSMDELLDHYLSSKPEWKDKRAQLIGRALELKNELEQELEDKKPLET